MSEAIALALPRLRCFRRPPARLILRGIYIANDCLACIYWLLTIAFAVRGVGLGGLPVGLKAALLALQTFNLVFEWARFREVLSAWVAGRAIAPVLRKEWRKACLWLVVLSGALVWVLIEVASK